MCGNPGQPSSIKDWRRVLKACSWGFCWRNMGRLIIKYGDGSCSFDGSCLVCWRFGLVKCQNTYFIATDDGILWKLLSNLRSFPWLPDEPKICRTHLSKSPCPLGFPLKSCESFHETDWSTDRLIFQGYAQRVDALDLGHFWTGPEAGEGHGCVFSWAQMRE